jgi:hypothetical protein
MYLFFSFPSLSYSLALGCFSRLDAPPYPCFSWPLREPRAFLASKEMPKHCRMASFAIDFKHANHASTMCAKACTLVLILFLLSLPRLGLSLSLTQPLLPLPSTGKSYSVDIDALGTPSCEPWIPGDLFTSGRVPRPATQQAKRKKPTGHPPLLVTTVLFGTSVSSRARRL